MDDWIEIDAWDLAAMTESWRAARPFAHLVIDGLVRGNRPTELLAAAAEEPCETLRDPLFEFDASAAGRFEQTGLASFRDELAGVPLLTALSEITGQSLSAVDMRAFAYHPGHYLLPHTDLHGELDRRLAYAYYLPTPEPVTGGELDLFACDMDGDQITGTRVEVTLAPTPNRIVVFEVGPHTLHQVREVTAGIRLSLAGWFYP